MLLILVFSFNKEYQKIVYASANKFDKGEIINILLIDSYDHMFGTSSKVFQGLKDTFEGKNISLNVEYMDSKQFVDKEYIENFHNIMKYKIDRSSRYDFIIAAEDNAFNFVTDNYDSLFSDIPVVFLGVNDIQKALEYNNVPNFTGVIEQISIKETFELTKNLNPNLNKIVTIFDKTVSSNVVLEEFETMISDFEGITIEILNLRDISYNELEKKVMKISDNSAIVLFSAYVDTNNQKFSFDEAISLISQNSKVPIYYFFEEGIGKGVLGGKFTSHYDMAQIAAGMIIDIVNGKKIEDIPIVEFGNNKYIFDYLQLKRFDMEISQLPDESVVLNKPFQGLKKYKFYIIVMGFLWFFCILVIIALIINILRRKKAEEEINHLAFRDSLTSLYNRNFFYKVLNEEIEKTKNKESSFALFFVDLNKFKEVNDTLGHSAGDVLLRKVSTRFKNAITKNEILCRFGGDEFLILIPGADKEASIIIAKRLLAVFKSGFIINNHVIYSAASIGAVMFPKDGADTETLFKNADIAMYKAKEAGENKIKFFNKSMKDKVDEEFFIENSLKRGFQMEEFYLMYQPIVDTYTEKILGAEVLVRWNHTQIGNISPEKFIPIAEKNGYINELGEWVLREACKQLKKIHDKGNRNVFIAVNISIKQIEKGDFTEMVKSIIKETGANPEYLELEVTESISRENLNHRIKIINGLRNIGVKFSIDDFGTGYSSLGMLQKLSISKLKIDRSFITNIQENENNMKIVKSVIALSKSLNLQVIAEGVETNSELEILQKEQCDSIQGYLFYKPLKTYEFEQAILNENVGDRTPN